MTGSTGANHEGRVLVVDDEAAVRGLVVRWLIGAGYECGEAADAEGAWRQLAEREFDLLTLDIAMPGESGIEFLYRIKRDFPDMEVMMLTGSQGTRAAIEALTHGACGYLIKPVERDELLFQVRRGLERRRLVLDNRHYTEELERKVHQQTAALRRAHEETIHRLLTASMYRDEETGAHIRRTGLYSEVMAEALGWPAERVAQIRLAAPMHDVGKIGIPDAILRKPGKLDAAEWAVMRMHPTIGADMLSGSESPMLQMAEEIARYHHERWDGTGYPDGLVGLEIPETARIVAIADVYDALTHDRVYRPALKEEEAVAVLEQGRGSHFDPMLTGVFLSLLPEMRRIAEEHPDEPTGDSWRDVFCLGEQSPFLAGSCHDSHAPQAG